MFRLAAFAIAALLLTSCDAVNLASFDNPKDANAAVNVGVSHTVSFGGNGADNPAAMAPQSIGVGQKAKLKANAFTRAGYSFRGWAKTTTGSVDFGDASTYTMGTADVTLYAIWTTGGGGSTGTITFRANGATSGSVPADVTATAGVVVTIPTGSALSFASRGTFYLWNTQSDGLGTDYTAGQSVSMVSGTLTLYALAQQTGPYTVTYSKNSSATLVSGFIPTGGSNLITGATFNLANPIPSPVLTGLVFVGWNTLPDGTGTAYTLGTSPQITIRKSNLTFYAQWTNALTVTYASAYTPTTGAVPTDSGQYAPGATTLVKWNTGALTLTGNMFTAWNTASDGTGTDYAPGATLTVGSSNVTLYAHWRTLPSASTLQLTPLTAPSGQSNFSSIAGSNDGTKLLVGQSSGALGLWRSTDSGATWSQSTGGTTTSQWWKVAMSSDGHYQAAVDSSGVRVSGDYGATFVAPPAGPIGFAAQTTTFNYSVDVSDTGQYMTANDSNHLWASHDYGATWTDFDTVLGYAVAASNDGTSGVPLASARMTGDGLNIQAVAADRIWTMTWHPSTSNYTANWWHPGNSRLVGYDLQAAMSSDGTRLYYPSRDSVPRLYSYVSNTTAPSTLVGSGAYLAQGAFLVACTNDGTEVLTFDNSGPDATGRFKISYDGGYTWTVMSPSNWIALNDIEVSPAGNHIFAVGANGILVH